MNNALMIDTQSRSIKTPADFQAVMAYKHPSLIQRLQRKCGMSEEAAIELFEDTKKFLYLCAESSVPLTPPPAIDECWHHALLFSRDYSAFCNQYFGAFIHHRPRYIGDAPADGSHRLNTLRMAEKKFGLLSHNWEFHDESNSDCDHCVRDCPNS